MFNKILIANRGEIACRIIKSARKMGIATVAVYSEADRGALHVELADEAVPIGPAPSRESYLVGDKIIAAAKQTGAQAIHPGYGFLSENAAFARQVEDEGLVFIGPKHASIAAMGDKIASKKLALAAGVNTIPGWNAAIETAQAAVRIAGDIGYPVMIKASAGGGGKGLRVAWDDQEAFEGFTACRNEARSSFGDDRVFIEKFVEQPRHIEIQVLGDAHGHLLWLNERECSIQRRHQKVIEEAPSPFISQATRTAMGEQAVALARAVDYQSAGTVEFVVGRDQSFYFLEMNTRLQVEHPVTECITGLDLVELMIRVAAGEALPLTQAQVRRDGWAMECRINAEDPLRNFLPSTGRLVKFQPPAASLEAGQPMPAAAGGVDGVDGVDGVMDDVVAGMIGGVRVDTGVEEGGEIPLHYDSMIAKLIVHGRDRADAVQKMRTALDGFVIRGVASNVAFQAALLAHPDFQAGEFDTGFIAAHYPHGFVPARGSPDQQRMLVALAAQIRRKEHARAAGISGQLAGHEVREAVEFVALVRDADPAAPAHEHAVSFKSFDARTGTSELTVDGEPFRLVSLSRLSEARQVGSVNGHAFVAQVERGTPGHLLAYRLAHAGVRLDVTIVSPRAAELARWMQVKALPDTSKFLLSPMPGLLVQLLATPGQAVRAGERLAVIEAMKMENILTAAQDGVVAELLAVETDTLAVDQPILRFE